MKIINFFSYKGGAGRSTLAYNIIPILAAALISLVFAVSINIFICFVLSDTVIYRIIICPVKIVYH